MGILSGYFSFGNIIENKKTNAVTSDRKKKAWEEIREEFNSISQNGPRTVDQLKMLYKNLKANTRKMVAEENVNITTIFFGYRLFNHIVY